MKGTAVLVLVFIFYLHHVTRGEISNSKALNNRPIIAILAQRYPQGSNQSYIAASYVKYIESAGARVVPIPHYFDQSKVEEIFKYVNGVLYPGGVVTMFTSTFYKNAKRIWELAIEANGKGNYFPIWLTCLGFQVAHVIVTEKSGVIGRAEASDVANYLNFTAHARSSRLFKNMPTDLYHAFATEDITYNHHNYGILLDTYNKHPELQKFFKILSFNNDVKGKKYISTIEARDYPFYGVQWHPEKNNFEFIKHFKNIPHGANAVRASQYMANFFVNEARKNFHKFPSKKMEDEHLIYRYTPVHSVEVFKEGTMSHFEQVYLF